MLSCSQQIVLGGNQGLGDHFRVLLRMPQLEELAWSLSEFSDLHLEGITLDGVLQLLEVDAALIGEWVEQVEVLQGPLLVPKDQVDPEVQVVGDVLTLQGCPVLLQEVFRRGSPLREGRIVNSLPVGTHTQIELLLVKEEFRVFQVELGDELLDIARVGVDTLPLLVDALEETVRVVKLPSLELDHPLRVLADEETDDVPWTTVVRAVQVLLLLRGLVVPFDEPLKPVFI